MNVQPLTDLVRANARVLEQGRALVARLSDDAYRAGAPEVGLASIGSHVRHVLDFYACFVAQVDGGRIDYDQRARDPRIETDPRAALASLERATHALAAHERDGTLEVRMEGGPWTRSSRARELAALLSHAVHHYALIAILLRRRGELVDPEFGVAPSTLRYWEESGASERS